MCCNHQPYPYLAVCKTSKIQPNMPSFALSADVFCPPGRPFSPEWPLLPTIFTLTDKPMFERNFVGRYGQFAWFLPAIIGWDLTSQLSGPAWYAGGITSTILTRMAHNAHSVDNLTRSMAKQIAVQSSIQGAFTFCAAVVGSHVGKWMVTQYA